jgi:hypothetical protein
MTHQKRRVPTTEETSSISLRGMLKMLPQHTMFLAVCFSKPTHDTSWEEERLEYNASLTRQSSLLDESQCGITVYMLPEFLHPPKCIEQVHLNTASLIQMLPKFLDRYPPAPELAHVFQNIAIYPNESCKDTPVPARRIYKIRLVR